VNGNKPYLFTLVLDAEMHHSLSALQVAQAQQAQLLTPDAVIEQGGEYRTIPYTLQSVRDTQQSPRLCVRHSRSAALIMIRCRQPLSPDEPPPSRADIRARINTALMT
jgi:hypothetical protein